MTSTWTNSVFDSLIELLLRLTTDGVRYIFAFFSALTVALLLTPVVREYARKIGMVDQPDARRINKVAVPRGGGVAVFVAFHLVLLAFTVLGGGAPISSKFDFFWQWRFFLASSLLLLVGLADDKIGVRPIVKLTSQVAVASILFFSGVKVGGIIVAFPVWLDYLVTVFWIVGAINAFNLIDGMDGLSTGLSLIACVGLAGALVFSGKTADTIPYLVLAGACLGFLRYNFHPASVFLGDSGSMFLGLCVATLPLMTGSRQELVASLGVPLLAMGIPIFDTMLAIWRRSARALLPAELIGVGTQTSVMQPDKEHVHHRVLRRTLNQRSAAMILYGVSAALVLVGLIGMFLRNHAPGFFMIAFIVATAVAVRHMISVELWDTGRLLSQRRATLRQAVVVPAYILLDVLFLVLAWITARFFSGLPLGRDAFLYNLPMVVAIIFVALAVSRSYRRVWSRAHARDYVLLTLALFASTLLVACLMLMFGCEGYNLAQFTMLMFACSFFPLIGLRVARESTRSFLHMIEKFVIREHADTERILVYGGGVRFKLYLNEMISRAGSNKTMIVGVVDDDIHLKGRIISGYEVLGGSDRLVDIVQTTGATRILIACDLTDEMERRLLKEFAGSVVKVTCWKCCEQPLR
ncbi:MAG: hypothetical protein PHO37_05260 [Kiritimatiellae bacterium]|nr:hypothetical protein [Kiritimatiellia bacterium]